ncbi:MAG: hypothetical protein HYW50_02510 [Candidatus Diapherotrites archaeon]|nr:hypothetical protein [Candidatus Diapherotrites archaeon]
MERMFKALFFLLFFTLQFLGAHADFFLVEPFEQKILDGGAAEIGVVSGGETFEIIVAAESSLGEGIFWNSLSVDQSTLPTGWTFLSQSPSEKRLVLAVTVPVGAQKNIYNLQIVAASDALGFSESFTARVRVRDDLLKVAINNPSLNQFPLNGEKTVYNIVLRNDSIAPNSLKISSTLQTDWFEVVSVEVAPKETLNASFEVILQTEGKKDFEIKVFSDTSQKEISSFKSTLVVRPTLFGKLSAPQKGFPFFSFSIAPFYFFNSMIFSLFD